MEETAERGVIEQIVDVVWHNGLVKAVSFLAGYVAIVVLVLLLAVAIPLGYGWVYFSVRRDDEIWHDLFQHIFRFYLMAAGVKLDIQGAENLPPDYRPVIVAANHQSMLDGPIMDLATGARRGVALTAPASYFPWPMSFWVAKVGSIQVARSEDELKKYGMRGALQGRVAIKRAVDALHKRHVSLLLFPEGHTEKISHPLPFQTGAIRIALASGAPLIPATIHNSGGIMKIKKLMLRPGTIHIRFHKQFPLPHGHVFLNDHNLVKLWTNQLLCRIAQDLPPSYFTPGMALACREVLGLNPLMRAALQERTVNGKRKTEGKKQKRVKSEKREVPRKQRARVKTKKKGASR